MTYLAVFDWNGTLFDDTTATHHATNECLKSFGLQEIDLHTLQDTFTFPLIHFYEKHGVNVDEYLARAEDGADIWLEAYENALHSCGIAVGAFNLLEWLQTQDFHCMVLSNHLQELLDKDVDRLGIKPFMQGVSGNAGKATIAKGLSKQIRLEAYMQENGFSADKTFIIGDSHEEPDLARRLGLLGISIAGGMLSAARLEKYKADHIVQSLDEVRPILEKHWKL